MKLTSMKVSIVGLFVLIMFGSVVNIYAEDVSADKGNTSNTAKESEIAGSSNDNIFPLLRDKMNLAGREKELPPPIGIMLVTSWMNSDWDFKSASVSVNGSDNYEIRSADDVTMDLQTQTSGFKVDLWLFPFLDLIAGGGNVDVDVTLGLRDIPLNAIPPVSGDAIVPMKFSGIYYNFGFVLAGAYKNLYAAVDSSFIKTKLGGDASLSTDGFWTFTGAPKIGYNAGLSQIYVGARYISKNEHYYGTVPLASGDTLGFDVKVKTASWVGNAGIRTVINNHWEFLMEVALGTREQITVGAGYRW